MTEQFFALSIAGGRGERLGSLTDDRPKPMVEINGKPIISYQIDWMRTQGITDVVFLCGYKGEMIQEYFGDGSDHGITAHYSYEKSPLGRGGALKRGLEIVPTDVENVLVSNGDVITDQPLVPISELHAETGAIATLMLVPYPNQYGVVELDNRDLVTRFAEKNNLPFWINAGVYMFGRQIESLLPEIGDHETTTFPDLAIRDKLAAYKSNVAWTSIENPKDISEFTDRLARRK
jgi:NDP-sugar pyrophosphorylase family protein